MSEMKWRPIETAPRDGTSFIGISSYTLDANDNPILWQVSYVGDGSFGQFQSVHDGEPFWDLTHWMPLPPPPEDV